MNALLPLAQADNGFFRERADTCVTDNGFCPGWFFDTSTATRRRSCSTSS